MKTLYLCGAINNCTDSECKDWRELVKYELVGRYDFLDPMRRDYRGREDQCVEEIVRGDLDDLDNSDVVLAMADSPSWGTGMEIAYAYMKGKPIIVVCSAGRVSPWLRRHALALVKTLSDAIKLLEAKA